MANRRKAGFSAGLFLVLITILLYGCAGGQATEQLVVTEYFLTDAGFKPFGVNDTTPKSQALLANIPKGKITAFNADGGSYYVYGDESSNTLYVGDEAAYQKYLSMSKGKQVCEKVDAASSVGFWSCFDELQKTGGGRRGR